MTKPTVFISYSHKDEGWKDRLRPHLLRTRQEDTGDFSQAAARLDRARADLEEALSIATRGGMRLHEADCHLEYARLHPACGEEEKARHSLAQAKEMIEDIGYHRRDGEVAELEGML